MQTLRALKTMAAAALVAGAGLLGSAANAATVTLTSAIQCSAGNAQNGIAVTNVTGNAGGASDCWGTVDGNDSQQTGTGSGDGFIIDTMLYAFVSKKDIGGSITGADIGLTVSSGTSGTWSVDATKFAAYGDFLIVLKAASSPGYGVWLFEGPHAASTFGNWLIAWTTGNNNATPNLSHLTVYAKPAVVPLPAAGLLLFGALGGLGLIGRRRRKAA